MKRTSAGAVFLTVVVDLIGFGIVLPLLPLYAKDFDANRFEMGALTASFSAMQFLFAPVWGRISDRVGRRPVLLIGLAGSVAFYTVFGFADSVPLLFVSRIGAGICGATISTSAAYIADVTAPEQRARGMALIGAAFGIGFTIGPAIGFAAKGIGEALEKQGTLTHPWSRALPGIIAATVSLAALLWTYFSLGEPVRHARVERRLFDLSALRGTHSPRSVMLLLGFSLLSVLAFSTFEATLSLMLLERFRMNDMDMLKVFVFVGVTLTVSQGVLVRRLAGPVGERTLARVGFFLMSAGLCWLAFSGGLSSLHGSLAVAILGFAAVTPSVSSLISRQASPAHQGRIMGLAQSASAMGRILGPLLGFYVYRPHDAAGNALAAVNLPLLGMTDHHRLPYLVGAVMAAGLAAAALAVLPAPPPADPPAG
jgi:MFS transporter, DHA1 family, tetracycline resistance protein